MARRSYGQACGIARFLDVLGERWTLLVVREILYRARPGEPKRFGELLERPPGISRNLLTERLKHLEAAGIVERSPRSGWQATAVGQELAPVLREIGEWGLGRTDDPTRARTRRLPPKRRA